MGTAHEQMPCNPPQCKAIDVEHASEWQCESESDRAVTADERFHFVPPCLVAFVPAFDREIQRPCLRHTTTTGLRRYLDFPDW